MNGMRLIHVIVPVALVAAACSSSSASEPPTVKAGAKCPVTTASSEPVKTVSPLLGDGLARPATGSTITIEEDSGHPGWAGSKVIWYTAPGDGSVVLTGWRLDGKGEVAFVEGDQAAKKSITLRQASGVWADDPTLTLVTTPGCYAFKADDGKSTSYVVVDVVRG